MTLADALYRKTALMAALLLLAVCITSSCSKEEKNITDGHEWVDLGLPSGTLWATCNIGAESPEESGIHFAWGETMPKEDYRWDTYCYCICGNDEYKLAKYCLSEDYGTVDDKMELEPEDDAATANWGSNWQMPSVEQLRELKENTTLEWTTQNGKHGRLFTSNINGNSIFLPAAGSRVGTDLILEDVNGNYWSRTLYDTFGDDARYFGFNSGGIDFGYEMRCAGKSIRPVRKQ